VALNRESLLWPGTHATDRFPPSQHPLPATRVTVEMHADGTCWHWGLHASPSLDALDIATIWSRSHG
jgi:hypothetical protein